jgi:hypothetical protein
MHKSEILRKSKSIFSATGHRLAYDQDSKTLECSCSEFKLTLTCPAFVIVHDILQKENRPVKKRRKSIPSFISERESFKKVMSEINGKKNQARNK